MVRQLKAIFEQRRKEADDWCCRLFTRRHGLPIRYFSARPNVGDSLNPYLIQRVSGRPVYEMRSDAFRSVLGVGSILHFATARSVVWGSGIISPLRLPAREVARVLEVAALRGEHTRELLWRQGANIAETAPLGDPALLMPRVYPPARQCIRKQYRLGLVPHYVDKDCPAVAELKRMEGVRVIDVEQGPEGFVDQLAQCEVIGSSSLHGLILADAYGIPNTWLKFSDNLLGGDFKFLDYLSTTDAPQASCLDVRRFTGAPAALQSEITATAQVRAYRYRLEALAESMPVQVP